MSWFSVRFASRIFLFPEYTFIQSIRFYKFFSLRNFRYVSITQWYVSISVDIVYSIFLFTSLRNEFATRQKFKLCKQPNNPLHKRSYGSRTTYTFSQHIHHWQYTHLYRSFFLGKLCRFDSIFHRWMDFSQECRTEIKHTHTTIISPASWTTLFRMDWNERRRIFVCSCCVCQIMTSTPLVWMVKGKFVSGLDALEIYSDV